MFDTLGNLFNSNAYANAGAGSMLAGAILVSSPIIIHLINRMRYKRIRWAAMEFLLKAQKRMRRKMIIEQLILLLLRILMILLIGLLIARFIGFGSEGQESRTTTHVILLDDSPSMGDPFKTDEGMPTTSFEAAKRLIFEQMMPNIEQTTTKQYLKILLLSDTITPSPPLESEPDKEKVASAGGDTPIESDFPEVTRTSIEERKNRYSNIGVSTVRVPLPLGITKAAEELNRRSQRSDTARVLHVVTDFRSPDWLEGGKAIKEAVENVAKQGIRVQFVDMAHPFRRADDKKSPVPHDNLAIVELIPSKPVVARFEPVEFTLKVQNFGTTEITGKRFIIKVNGDESKGQSRIIPTILPGQPTIEKFSLTFDRTGTADNPFERFSLVTVGLAEEEAGGLEIDNVRHTVVEVRDRHPILVIDGNPDIRERREGNSIFLNRYFTGADEGAQSYYRWVNGDVSDLKKPDLSKYAFILILNVPSIPEDCRVGLENYIKAGGGCAFFLGGNVKPGDYNTILYRDGAGCFPVPLPDQPSKELSEDERAMKLLSFKAKLLLRDPSARTHPAIAGLYTDERGQLIRDVESFDKFFRFVTITRHWPVKRGAKWVNDPTVRELYCLPNEEPISQDYERAARDIANELPIPAADPAKKSDPLPGALQRIKRNLLQAAAEAKTVSELSVPLDQLLVDQQAGTADPEDIALREFWARGDDELRSLRTKAIRLRDAVKYGDPFYITKEFGKGRVALFTTTSGEAWNDWGSGPGRASFPPVMKELSTYLAGGAADSGHSAGLPLEYEFEPGSYRPEYRSAFMTHKHETHATNFGGTAPITNVENGLLEGSRLSKKQTRAVGAYLFELKQLVPGPKPSDPPGEVLVYRAAAVNVDALTEGNLQRAASDDIKQNLGPVPFYAPDDNKWLDDIKKKKSDLSELGWIFAILLLILVLEQAMSVRLSYHASADSTAQLAPSAAQAMRASGAAAMETPRTAA